MDNRDFERSDEEYRDVEGREEYRDVEGREEYRDVEGREQHIPIVEEEMRVGKREVEQGGVRIRKSVVEEPVEETHTLRDETVNVERRPADRMASEADFQERTIEAHETDEELVADKRARVTGEVVVKKQVEERPETVRDTLRRTEVETEDLGAEETYETRDESDYDHRNNL